ncbi:MAG: tetratricopeptide repeat protein [Gluconacetobacter diazotrophicus]|nr:tetratricopeptide repeat protein [Gluconacetobacter diazotrophicus]
MTRSTVPVPPPAPDGLAARLAADGVSRHRAGDRAAADALYRDALSRFAAEPVALHGLGVLALEAGRSGEAIAFLGRATAAAPDRAEPYLHLGLALHDQGHLEPARAALHVCALRDPADPRAPAAMAAVLEQQDRFAEAATAAAGALHLDPAAGTPAARASGAHALLGRAAARDGRHAVAADHFDAALRESPADTHSAQELGRSSMTLGDPGRAEAAFRRVLAAHPTDPAAQANLGIALFELNRHPEAEPLLRAAAASSDPTPATLSNLGLVLMATGALFEAAAVLERAAAAAPTDDGIAVNLGSVRLDLGRHAEAESGFAAVERRSPSSPDAVRARFNRGTSLLATGRFREGWRLFESRRAILGAPPNPGPDLPDWDGQPLPASLAADAAVLLRPEQGLGDCLQFLRFAADAARIAPVLLLLPPSLHPLVEPLLSPRCGLFREPADRNRCVAAASLLSLPFLLGLAAPVSTGPYLSTAAPPGPPASFDRFRVGLAWAGSANYRFDARRSLPLRALAPLRDLPGLDLVSLQQGPAAAQSGLPLDERLPPDASLSDTAALIAGLDALVAVDSAVAHLAGALGRRVLLLNRFGGDWRWRPGNLHPDGRSMWYPDATPFTQERPGDWSAPLAAIIGRLAALRRTAT